MMFETHNIILLATICYYRMMKYSSVYYLVEEVASHFVSFLELLFLKKMQKKQSVYYYQVLFSL